MQPHNNPVDRWRERQAKKIRECRADSQYFERTGEIDLAVSLARQADTLGTALSEYDEAAKCDLGTAARYQAELIERAKREFLEQVAEGVVRWLQLPPPEDRCIVGLRLGLEDLKFLRNLLARRENKLTGGPELGQARKLRGRCEAAIEADCG